MPVFYPLKQMKIPLIQESFYYNIYEYKMQVKFIKYHIICKIKNYYELYPYKYKKRLQILESFFRRV